MSDSKSVADARAAEAARVAKVASDKIASDNAARTAADARLKAADKSAADARAKVITDNQVLRDADTTSVRTAAKVTTPLPIPQVPVDELAAARAAAESAAAAQTADGAVIAEDDRLAREALLNPRPTRAEQKIADDDAEIVRQDIEMKEAQALRMLPPDPRGPTADQPYPDDFVNKPKGGLVNVQIARSFTLVRADGTRTTFTPTGTNCEEPGFYDVTAEDADHWFLRAHTANPPPPIPPMPGTMAAREAGRVDATNRMMIESAKKQEEADQTENERRVRQSGLENKLGDSFKRSI